MLKFYVQVLYLMGKARQASYPVPVTGLVVFHGKDFIYFQGHHWLKTEEV